MLETFITWFLIGIAIKLYYDNFSGTKPRRRKGKDQFEDLIVAVVVIVILGLVLS